MRTMLGRLNAEIGVLQQSHTDTSGVVGEDSWCTIETITLKQIFLKPDSCDSCGHSFLVSDSQYTPANHDFVSDSVIGIDIDADTILLKISFLYLEQGDTHPPTYPATPTPLVL